MKIPNARDLQALGLVMANDAQLRDAMNVALVESLPPAVIDGEEVVTGDALDYFAKVFKRWVRAANAL